MLRGQPALGDHIGARLDQLAAEWPGHLPLIGTLRTHDTHRLSYLGRHGSEEATQDDPAHADAATQERLEHQAIRHAVIHAERAAVLDMRDRGQINDEVWRRIERNLDLEEVRMEA